MRTSKRSRRRARGFSLLECMAYVALLAVVVNVALTSFVSAVRLNQAALAAVDRTHDADAFALAYRNLVRGAVGALPSVADYVADEQTLLLALPPTEEGAARFAVISVLPADAKGAESGKTSLRVLKLVTADGALAAASVQTYHLPAAAVRFRLDAPPEQAKLATIDLFDAEGAPAGAVVAALRTRGDVL